MGTFVNFSNHPSEKWDLKQKEAAQQYGEIVDVAFPAVDPHLDEGELKSLAESYIDEILQKEPACVMAQGEFTLCYLVVQNLIQRGIPMVAACSERNTEEKGNSKISVFEFIRFRRYG